MEKALHTLSLTEVLDGIASRRFTCETYIRALLVRIGSLEKEVRAWAWLEPAKALEAARISDQHLGAGGKPGPLQGLPIAVKDIFSTAGMPTEMGSPAFAGHIPDRSARVIERLEANGAFVMGKAVTTECAFLFPGKTRNPWNAKHTPGGSSSGSAAAVAAGFVPAALGTQTNGSTIRPAAFCGVVGFKPTQGLLSIEGALTFSHTLDQVGIFTRSVKEAARLTAFLTVEGVSLSPEILSSDGSPRLAAVRTPFWELAEDHAKQTFIESIAILRKEGAHVDEVEMPSGFGLAHQTIRTIMTVEGAFNLEDLYLKQAFHLSPILKDFLSEGRTTGAIDYAKALRMRLQLKEELARLIAGYEAIITLPTTGEAPATLEQTGNPGFCTIWNLCGVPSITIPVGFGPRGLPLGLQIVGPEGKDDQVLSVAHWCEKQFPFQFLR